MVYTGNLLSVCQGYTSALGDIWLSSVPFSTGSCNGRLQCLEHIRLKFSF